MMISLGCHRRQQREVTHGPCATQREMCEAMSAFPQHILGLPCNVFISVISPHHPDDGVTVSQNYWSPAIIVVV